MRKRIRICLAILLCAAMLSGCREPVRLGDPSELAERLFPKTEQSEDRRAVSFDEIEYVRPDVENLAAQVEVLRDLLQEGNYSKVRDHLDAIYAARDHFDTMDTLAYIRNSQNMSDEFYAEEYAWCDDQSSEVDRIMEQMLYACGMSDMAETLEKRYFWEGFAEEYSDDSEALYDDELVELYQQEAALLSRYRSLVASPTITLPDGTEVDYYSHLADAYGQDYLNAVTTYYTSYNQALGEVYIDLIRVRSTIAEKLGYDNYEQMQYEYYWERDFSPEEAEVYLKEIRTWMVPLYEEVQDVDPYSYISSGRMSESRLRNTLESGVRKLGGAAEEAFDFMTRYGLYDIKVDSRKVNSSFQTYLTDYDSPFLFMNPSGTTEDVTTFAHEFGHFTEAYANYNANETIDLAEVYSQAMEYLMLFQLEGEMSESSLDNLWKSKMLDSLDMYVQQASFAEFEHQVYSRDPNTLTVEDLNAISLQTSKDYGYFSPGYEIFYGMGWIDIVHFFEYPFYVIAYPVSNDLALQIYELERDESGAGAERYAALLDRDYDSLLLTAQQAGLESPFAEGRLEKAAQDLRDWLDPAVLAA